MDRHNYIEDIKDRVDIVDIVSDYTDLKKTGKSYKALCPFHSEKTPSFVVSPDKQIFHCFGCGAGGDAITFVMKQEGISFAEAIQLLAEKTGITIKTAFSPQNESLRNREMFLKIQRASMHFFADLLQKSKRALEYLYRRGYTDETIKTFSLGYAQHHRDSLYRHMKGEGFSEKDLIDSGIIREGKHGYADTFRERIMFPISDIHGNPLAFGGRAIGEGLPKYLNSAESSLFKKGEVLYGLHLARNHIAQRGSVIVVEGYLDVIACFQHGFRNVLGTLGTAFTDKQVRLLKRYTKEVLLLFDSDSAGIAAAKRSLDILYSNNLTARILLLPENEDPDSFLRRHGAEQFEKMFSQAHDFIDFMFSIGKDSVETVRDILSIISHMSDAILKSKLLSELSDRASVSEVVLREEMEKFKKKKGATPKAQQQIHLKSAEEILLGIYLSFPETATTIHDALNPDEIEDPFIRRVFHALYSLRENFSLSYLSPLFNSEEIAHITRLMIDPLVDRENIEENIRDCLKNIRKMSVKRSLIDLEVRIKRAESSRDEQKLRDLLIKKQDIIKERANAGNL